MESATIIMHYKTFIKGNKYCHISNWWTCGYLWWTCYHSFDC